jgi:hypothetical protein
MPSGNRRSIESSGSPFPYLLRGVRGIIEPFEHSTKRQALEAATDRGLRPFLVANDPSLLDPEYALVSGYDVEVQKEVQEKGDLLLFPQVRLCTIRQRSPEIRATIQW